MDYCLVGQWVIDTKTGYLGRVIKVKSRRNGKQDGQVIVEFTDELKLMSMRQLREATGVEKSTSLSLRSSPAP